jgi:predicted RNA-binding Zn-ribbon protein involved in translation (DUF1610 family)
MNHSRTASGFPCPSCGQRRLAKILSHDTTHILELQCIEESCGWTWAVELVVSE